MGKRWWLENSSPSKQKMARLKLFVFGKKKINFIGQFEHAGQCKKYMYLKRLTN